MILSQFTGRTAVPLITLTLFAISCGGNAGSGFANTVESASNKAAYAKHEALAVDLHLRFGGRDRIVGRMIMETSGDRSRFELQDGAVLIYDGSQAHAAPPSITDRLKKVRFEVLTWPYFLELPFKLQDPGTQLTALGELQSNGRNMPAARLTFDSGVGDTPDDWYVLYRDPGTGLLDTAGYIVTYGQSVEQGEEEPHAIVYSDYVDVDGVRIATDWKFHLWTQERGIFGDPIGTAKLSNLEFVKISEGMFDAPENAVIDELPGD